MDKDFEILEHTADIGIIAYGNSLKETLSSAAKGMFGLITELESIGEVERREIEIVAADRESLLVAWLNELIYLFDVENLLFSRFEISRLSDTEIKATAYGEKADSSRHDIKMGIKATTWHMLEVKDNSIRVLFDI